MVIFRTMEGINGKHHYGFINSMLCYASDIFWAADELGFNPNTLLYKEYSGYPASGSWVIDETDEESDSDEVEISNEFMFDVGFELGSKLGWHRMTTTGLAFEHILVECEHDYTF